MTKNYDIIIIGNGAAAFAAAIKASELSENDASILMIGYGPMGGTCVNVGCIPSKYLLEVSNTIFYSKQKRFEGIEIGEIKPDFRNIMEGLRNTVKELRKNKYEEVLKAYPNIEYLEGKVRFFSTNEIGVDGKVFKAKNILIAVGSRPSIPNIEGLNEIGYLTSNTIWDIDSLPGKIAIIGAGAIGLEIGQAFLHLGSQVVIIEALNRIAPQSEYELSQYLQNNLEEEGMQFVLKARINKVKKAAGKKILEIVTARGKEELEVDEILVATGRKPNTDQLMLEKANVETTSNGFIVTNKRMQTSNPRIYAAGDCVSKRLMLETLAAREGTVAVSNILGLEEEMDYLHVPSVIFTYPQLASVGYLESEYVNEYGKCSCNLIKLEHIPKAHLMKEKRGLIKIVIEPTNGKIVGIHALAPYASEFIIEATLAIRFGLTIKDLIDTVHAFPTLSEGIKIAAQSFVRNVERMSCCVE
ncbi:MAG TPA: mercury(II) reductase [Geobacterales bacterium]|nr:mercury(II) reductase [Geobacterales bacterium]